MESWATCSVTQNDMMDYIVTQVSKKGGAYSSLFTMKMTSHFKDINPIHFMVKLT